VCPKAQRGAGCCKMAEVVDSNVVLVESEDEAPDVAADSNQGAEVRTPHARAADASDARETLRARSQDGARSVGAEAGGGDGPPPHPDDRGTRRGCASRARRGAAAGTGRPVDLGRGDYLETRGAGGGRSAATLQEEGGEGGLPADVPPDGAGEEVRDNEGFDAPMDPPPSRNVMRESRGEHSGRDGRRERGQPHTRGQGQASSQAPGRSPLRVGQPPAGGASRAAAHRQQSGAGSTGTWGAVSGLVVDLTSENATTSDDDSNDEELVVTHVTRSQAGRGGSNQVGPPPGDRQKRARGELGDAGYGPVVARMDGQAGGAGPSTPGRAGARAGAGAGPSKRMGLQCVVCMDVMSDPVMTKASTAPPLALVRAAPWVPPCRGCRVVSRAPAPGHLPCQRSSLPALPAVRPLLLPQVHHVLAPKPAPFEQGEATLPHVPQGHWQPPHGHQGGLLPRPGDYNLTQGALDQGGKKARLNEKNDQTGHGRARRVSICLPRHLPRSKSLHDGVTRRRVSTAPSDQRAT